MPVRVTFRAGAERAAQFIGLPSTAVAGGVVVSEPPGWTERNLTSHIIQRVGPYLRSIETVQTATRLNGCNCIHRR